MNSRGRPRHDDVLTPAEWRVAEQVRHGLTNRRIAERMGVSVDAVKFHVANALAKLGFASRDELRRWPGVGKATALHRAQQPGGSTMTDELATGSLAMTLAQVSRTTANFDAARAWYHDTLGLPEIFAFPGLAFFDLGGVRLMLSGEGKVATPESILYLRVTDIHRAKDALEQRGVRFINAPHLIHRHPDGSEEWMAAFEDNEGRPLQLTCVVRAQSAR